MGVCTPEFVLERVLGTNVGLSFSPRGPAARQVLGVPGPAGQIDWLLWRHWDKKRREGEKKSEVLPPQCNSPTQDVALRNVCVCESGKPILMGTFEIILDLSPQSERMFMV